ncbi:restriction endonuclease [Streptomyces silaceus]|uniref:restriction endonuclease n=1 Tax=Streptomyces silaceus TaxID=545123 RepID=UPI0006EB7D2E|nr:restriction endonuclease [Streptomyces silaceus]
MLLVVGTLTGARWLADRPALAALLVVAVVAAACLVGRQRMQHGVWAPPVRHLVAANPRTMGPRQFEHFLADLCRRDGCRDVTVVGGANDHGADVLYTDPSGRRGLIQAKRHRHGNGVGNPAVQVVNGTYRDAHHCHHAAIVTTSHFTVPARQFAHQVGIELVDGRRLHAWMRGQRAAAPWNRATTF